MPELLSRTGYRRSWTYRLFSENRFPQPIKGVGSVEFIEIENNEWLSQINLTRIFHGKNKCIIR
ncbi:AlpA family phage regulatory protein [Yersinia pseudotuberculosis]|uniref:AlpA family phage regulatory protein n=1 Tax=Yersinia pseudotuberculosis TaxID=633 RepID=UPI0036F2A384